MAQKVKFPLEMGNGVKVRTLDQLRSSFSMEEVFKYYVNGKLIVWLRNRAYNDVADSLEKLDKNDIEISKKICKIFNVDYSFENINTSEIEANEKKIEKLKEYVDYTEYLGIINEIAFSQEELDKSIVQKMQNDEKKIYLCGEKFEITNETKNIEYIGINKTTINLLSSNKTFDAEKNNIKFVNIVVTSDNVLSLKIKYRKTFDVDNSKVKILDNVPSCETINFNEYNLILTDNNGKVHVSERTIESPWNINKWSNSRIFSKLNNIVSVGIGKRLAVVLDKNGDVYEWENNVWRNMECKNSQIIKQIKVKYDTTTQKDNIIAIDKFGKLHCWTDNRFTAVEEKLVKINKEIERDNLGIIRAIWQYGVIMAVDNMGKVHIWSDGSYKNVNKSNLLFKIPLDLPPIVKIVLFEKSVFALDNNGKIHFWGKDEYGNSKIPDKLPYITDISNENETIISALDQNGKVHVWANNSESICGSGILEKIPPLKYLVGIGGIDDEGYFYNITMDSSRIYLITKAFNGMKIQLPVC